MATQIGVEEILSCLPGHVYWFNTEGVMLGCNDEQAEVFGYSNRHAIIGKSLYDFLPQAEADVIIANNKKVILSGKPHKIEETVTLANGERHTFISYKKPLLDASKKIIGVIGSSINITSIKLHEDELIDIKEQALQQKKSSESYLKSIIENLPICLYWEDLNGVFLGMNDEHARIMGLKSAQELIGKSIYDTIELLNYDKEFIHRVRENDLSVIRDGKTISVEEEMNFPDGTIKTHLSKKTPLRNDDNVCIGLLGVSIDITQQKQLEKQLTLEKEKAEFANLSKTIFIANVSHDLRTPLQSLLSATEYLHLKNSLPEEKEWLDTILQSGKILQKLINNIIEFSKLEEGMQIQEEPFNLKEVMQDCLKAFETQAKDKNIELILDYSPDLPLQFISDVAALRRIIFNLVSNAIKFTLKGFVRLSLIPCLIEQEQVQLKIKVEDSGIGIAQTDLPKIFDRFYRVTPSYKGQVTGFGLGLAIIKKLVECLNGKIEVISDCNKGSQFICTLTLKKHLVQDHPQIKQNALTLKKDLQLSILLIEDVALIQKIITHLLKESGCEVTLAGDGETALRSLEKRYDLIFMDVGLPDQDGFLVIEKIRAMKTINQNTPIIVLTAHASEEIKERCYQAGATDFLMKPISYEDLLNCIQGHIPKV